MKYKTRSFDETKGKIIEKTENEPESMFGAHPKMSRFTESDESNAHEF